jgi:Secretion system C-terminal sorting domain
MAYKDEFGINDNLIRKFRSVGYDVILVNQPTYWLINPSNPNTVRKINGGADFVERNGLALATLIKRLNVKLAQNNSTEKIVIMGPSMGGQISRYALAWMEKKFAETALPEFNHNTRLWVAFDSPNHGANVPLGDQALINLLKEASTDVEKIYNESLNSNASREMMIELHEQGADETTVNSAYLNGSTISQGMPTNSGNPHYQSHYNNQFNNGLPNSKGFPVNLRKIAIINGSLTGKTFGGNLENMLDVRGIQRVCIKPVSLFGDIFGWSGGPSYCFTIKLAEMQAWTMPASGNYGRISYFDKIVGAGKHTNATNFNNRGNMDIVPGGMTDVSAVINSSITGRPVVGGNPFTDPIGFFTGMLSSVLGGADWQTRNLMPNNSFIPTFSSIGIKNPNQNWATPLDRNLVCSNEIYFDSYFGEAENTNHTELNYRSVNWLLKELGTNTIAPSPQAPYFPLPANTLTGPTVVCTTANSTFTLGSLCKIPSPATWTVTPNLQIISQNGTNVVVKGLTNGNGKITAAFQNGMKVEKTVWVGKPNSYNTAERVEFCNFNYRILPYPNTVQNATYSWQFVSATGGASANNFSPTGDFLQFYACPPFSINMNMISTNACGTTIQPVQLSLNNDEEEINRIANPNIPKTIFKIYPNPSKDIVNIDLRNQENQPKTETQITGELFDMMGISVSKVQIKDNKATFSVEGLRKGIYVVKIYINDQVETHQIAVE